MAGHTPGPDPKGRRKQRTIRVPLEQDAVYLAAAKAEGLGYTDYVALVLARHHDLCEPSYIHRAGGGQRELPIGA